MRTLSLNGSDWTLTGWYRNQWRFTESMELGTAFPPAIGPLPAKVPGAVQADLLRSGRISDPNIGLRSMESEWVENREWAFEKTFVLPDGWVEDRCELVLEGLDFAGEMILNGTNIASFEGMFTPYVIDVTSCVKTAKDGPNHLYILFRQVPEVDGQYGYTDRVELLKSRFNYVWDWCPRIVPVGIWKGVCVRTYSHAKIIDFYPQAAPSEDLASGRIDFSVTLDALYAGSLQAEYEVVDDAGRCVASERTSLAVARGTALYRHTIGLHKVDLWWPAGYGEPYLYTAKVRITDEKGCLHAEAEKKIGFRRVEMVSNANAPAGALPYTVVVNGRSVFLKGVNWVPISPLLGTIERRHYEAELSTFQRMNINLLRVWGGAIFEQEPFYDYCDANGLFVWQDFLQSSSGIVNCPSSGQAFMDRLMEAGTHAIREKRTHPSLLLWCGGNELMWEGFVPVDERHANIAMLKRLVGELDPGRPFLPTSASGPRFTADERDFGQGVHHDVHGPWNYLGETAHYDYFNRDDALFRSETGAPGMAGVDALHKWKGGHSVWPPTKMNPYWVHRGAWWIQWDQLGELSGPWSEDKDELVIYAQMSRFLQWESLRYAAEAVRRREPAASGFIVWMGNEPFANCANTSLVEYGGMPKPAYYGIKKAFSSRFVSARYERLAYRAGERFVCELYLHEERDPSKIAGSEASVTASIYGLGGQLLANRQFEMTERGRISLVGQFEWDVQDVAGAFLLRVELACIGMEPVCDDYLFAVAESGAAPLFSLRSLPPSEIVIRQSGERIEVENVSTAAAIGVFLKPKGEAGPIVLDRNYLMLLPGQRVSVTGLNRRVSTDELAWEGFNVSGCGPTQS
ncbi:glycoside hydrolase family 2 protein [Paenibacillus nasutitermitis]|uniref:beta-mannosidase n=1 Tax=Paenibacillus nasutitermitis TaxID=1652958 RepID=A0A916ZE15_9BACL|nr:glycoside hydrolase family 2 TIM barrel-domain containing protein [Paenibacillus nasutitermitis]GGD89669.1 hypothetical protein GCM10010911_55360 [Paenibacillus nasutitermitis]